MVLKHQYLQAWLHDWWVDVVSQQGQVEASDWANVATTMLCMLAESSTTTVEDRERLAFETSQMVHEAISLQGSKRNLA
ncbi:hypothetical protein UFOVP236_8 [uncultured Caudovirales phage]|uniref:Uncharacterized protein n=1 Tax=uncultured Caudovirales phage TaxID=2100421 RepID=A0A6J7WZ04_9CAUD|nr:hypothetical protein UFOVP236_8 [uncultured Caudovirales phage]